MLFHDFFLPFFQFLVHSKNEQQKNSWRGRRHAKKFSTDVCSLIYHKFLLWKFSFFHYFQFFSFFFVSEELEGFSLSMFLFPLPCWSSLSEHKFGKVCSPPRKPSPPLALHRSGLKSLWIICIKKSKAFCMNFRLMHKFSSWLDCWCFLCWCCGATAHTLKSHNEPSTINCLTFLPWHREEPY